MIKTENFNNILPYLMSNKSYCIKVGDIVQVLDKKTIESRKDEFIKLCSAGFSVKICPFSIDLKEFYLNLSVNSLVSARDNKFVNPNEILEKSLVIEGRFRCDIVAIPNNSIDPKLKSLIDNPEMYWLEENMEIGSKFFYRYDQFQIFHGRDKIFIYFQNVSFPYPDNKDVLDFIDLIYEDSKEGN